MCDWVSVVDENASSMSGVRDESCALRRLNRGWIQTVVVVVVWLVSGSGFREGCGK
jgi:hypothetical protein